MNKHDLEEAREAFFDLATDRLVRWSDGHQAFIRITEDKSPVVLR